MNATIFFGNGINRISDKPLDWNELLKRLAVYASVKVDLAEKPYTMIYEELLLRSKSMDESNIKKYIQQELQVTDISSLYERLYSIGVTNYIVFELISQCQIKTMILIYGMFMEILNGFHLSH